MSGDSTDSEISTNNNNNTRSRSILRQVRETIGGINRSRHRPETITNGPSLLTLINNKRGSADSMDTHNSQTKLRLKKISKATTPVSFSHRLSLLNQVKSHITKTRKSYQTTQSPYEDEVYTHLSLPRTIPLLESKSSSPLEINQDSGIKEIDSPPAEILINTMHQTVDHRAAVRRHDSLDISTHDDDIHQTDDMNSTLSSSRISLNKFKEQLTQRTRTVLNKSPSLTSILTNTSSPTYSSEPVYWIELCIERGKDLSVKDLNGASDPYVKIYYGTEEKHTTNTVYKNLNPIWNEKFSFFIYDLNIPIYFYLFDYDRIGRDETMGSTKIDLSKLPFEKTYSAVLDLDNEKRTDGKIGMLKISITISLKTSEFRDEVLRSLPKQLNTKVSLSTRSGATNSITAARRTVDVFVIEGRNLTAIGSVNKMFSPYIRLKFGANKKYRTQTSKSTVNPKWHQSFIYDVTMNELPPLELTIMDDTGSSGDFMGRGICNLAHLDEERTHRISVDLEDNAGVIDLFVTITGTIPLQEGTNDSETSSNMDLDVIPSKLTDEDIEYYSLYSSLKSIQPLFDVGKVEIKIYQARDLSSKDINGKSDPFCVVELDTTRLRTHTIYKTLAPVWTKSFVIPVQDIHSVLELTIFDEDNNKTTEFIGKIAIPLLAIKNGEKKWMTLKDRKCILPVKGIIEIEATLIYTDLKAIIRTFNPRQVRYYQQDGKFRVAVFKQHINRIRNMLKSALNVVKFIDYCFQWENPILSFLAFIISMLMVWNLELYMIPCGILLLFGWNAIVEYRRGRLGKPFATLGDETVSTVIQPASIDEDVLESDVNIKEQKRSLMSVIHGIQDTVLEIQGYVDEAASTLERIKNVFNFTVPWLSILAIIVLTMVSIILYHIPLRYLVLLFIINKFTKRFRKPKDYIDNNELADFISRLPSDPELLQYREFKILSHIPTPKKTKR